MWTELLRCQDKPLTEGLRPLKFIVITSPETIADEAELIETLFSNGLDILHLRKPQWSEGQCECLLDRLSARNAIVVHDHHELCAKYGLRGVHLNRRNPIVGVDRKYVRRALTVSASCHSIEEVEKRKQGLDYLFLSPVFDSISKKGYNSAFSMTELEKASEKGIIDEKVMALGGVTLEVLPLLRSLRFGGAAFLGDVWCRAADKREFASHARQLANALHDSLTEE